MMTFNDRLKKMLPDNATIEKIHYSKSTRDLEILIQLGSLIDNSVFSALEKTIKEDLPMIHQVKVFRQYDLSVDNWGAFIQEHKDLIFTGRKNLTNSILTSLLNSEIVDDEKSITFKIHDSIAFKKIKNHDIEHQLQTIFKNEFNQQLKITIVMDENDQVMKQFSESRDEIINQMVSEMDVQRQKNASKKVKTKRSADPNVYNGRVKTDIINIADIEQEGEYIGIKGELFQLDSREIRGGKLLIMFALCDNTSSIGVKLFAKKDTANRVLDNMHKGDWYAVEGTVRYDRYDKELAIFANRINSIQNENEEKRKDLAEDKRVELHLHTNMSSMDGLSSPKALIKRAHQWGHEAVAITDHGVVQAFPDAMAAADEYGIKIIYGLEGYLFNDTMEIIKNADATALNDEFVVFDLETTGLNKSKDQIIEIGAVLVRNKQVVGRYNQLVKPDSKISHFIQELTGINNQMVKDQPTIDEVLPEFLSFVDGRPLVAHNADFDMAFITREAQRLTLEASATVIDTLGLSRLLIKEIKRHKLKTVARFLKVDLDNHHRAIDDALATGRILIKLFRKLEERGVETLKEINQLALKEMDYKSVNTNHVIILAKNKTGLRNLYELVSSSKLETFYRQPRIPKSLLNNKREGLLIGSACEAGELFRAIIDRKNDKVLDQIVEFYDYLEVQPIENNQFLIDRGIVDSKEDIMAINKKIIALAEKHNKLVVATGDVHFLDPSDDIYRKILMSGKGFSDADNQPPLYLKTTQEMLKDFDYLDDALAKKIVIDNTQKINAMIDTMEPIPRETFPPVIEGSDEDLRDMCYDKARSIYGEDLPAIVEDRLAVELDSIISNGYSVLYIISQKLVKKSLDDGYLVGSRGSVGSSFAATMSDITEVNPLPPHYICENCQQSEFITTGEIGAGVDLPDKTCPNCGHPYKKDGYDIPFEVFLGFGGGKEPDIDLNFAGVYQATAHQYTEELFGEGNVYKAGTIGTIADKTAYGFVKKYFEEREIEVPKKEVERLSDGCTGVKRTSGQHPGGLMIVPNSKDIHDFTPIQYPANDVESDVITTHFDYHAISGRLLKLDILGHDVPTMLRQLVDLTGVAIENVPLDDQETMSIFTSVKALAIEDKDYKINSGSLGIPEFGTNFVRQMLKDTQPTTFSELVRISGLSHGTDVWLNNAQELIRNNVVQLKDVISTRDDIMNYLIYKGLPSKKAFTIMEKVRKGKGLTEAEVQLMKENNVPNWYIDSCKKIKYMFPKAHAVAYVMMSFRIAYFKVHYPLAFYTTYFSTKVNDFNAQIICKGKEAILTKMEAINTQEQQTKKDKDLYSILEIAYEMYARGFDFLNVDLYQSHYNKFLLVDDKILPPLQAIDGVGESAAYTVYEARDNGEFLSIEDLKNRTKLNKTGVEALQEHGSLNNLPESNQLAFF